MKDNNVVFSVVVPVLNEEKNVKQLHQEIVSTMEALEEPYEIIFIDDGSTDNTAQVLKSLSPMKLIQLRRNTGQSSALDAGITHSKGQYIITMDGDGQNDPKDIPSLLTKMNEGYDVVCGWREKRKDTFSKRFISIGARYLRKIIIDDDIRDAVCALRIYKRECFERLELYGEMHRMIPAILQWQGFSVTEIPVNHRPRIFGSTKYNWKRTIKGLLDMINVWFLQKYQGRPLHLFGSVGLLLIIFSTLLLSFLVVSRLFFGVMLAERIWPLIGVTGWILGVQFLALGLLADLIIRNGNHSKYYSVKEIYEK